MFRVKNLKTAQSRIQVTGFKNFLTAYFDSNLFVINIFDSPFKADLFQVEYYLGYILNNTCYGRELMVDSFDLYRCNGKTFERREEYPSQRITDSNTIARFKRAELELAVLVVRFKHYNFIRLLEC